MRIRLEFPFIYFFSFTMPLRTVTNEKQHQFVSTSADSLNFGYGTHACPGRYFASAEIKLIIIELLLNWDLRLKGDIHEHGGVDKRPESRQFRTAHFPNQSAQIEVRRRKI
jgi:cytochrome P450